MGRRIRWLGIVMVVCLGLVVAQLVNIQLVKGKQLQDSPNNPRVAAQRSDNARGEILASDGTVLAQSVPTPAGTDKVDYPYDYVREYPQGPLYADVTGYDSALNYGSTDIENEYDSYLGAHQQAPQTLSQLLFRQKMPTTTDNVKLTIEPSLQNAAWQALTETPGPDDGAVVVLNPKTGAVLAMVSNPTYDPNTLASTSLQAEHLAYLSYTAPDGEGYFPLRSIATSESFFPGSTMKVVTSAAAYNLKPSLAGFDYPVQPCQNFSDSNRLLCNDGSTPSDSVPCGGTMTSMLPESCDPGYAELTLRMRDRDTPGALFDDLHIREVLQEESELLASQFLVVNQERRDGSSQGASRGVRALQVHQSVSITRRIAAGGCGRIGHGHSPLAKRDVL